MQVAGVGDFNGDGRDDILWLNTKYNEFSVSYSAGGGLGGVGFQYPKDLGSYDFAWQVQGVGDFNGDGKADILWRNASSNDVQIWIGDGVGGFVNEDLGFVASSGTFRKSATSMVTARPTSSGATTAAKCCGGARRGAGAP
jgi:hypothetical protein